jgi:exodeoxyribonuclease V alpha subunit
MLDLALAARLLDALPAGARLVMLGDKDQLAAVEAGAVFAELSADAGLTPATQAALSALLGTSPTSSPSPAAAWADTTVWFTRSHRFDGASGIGRLALAVRDGRPDEALALLAAPPDATLAWHDTAPGVDGEEPLPEPALAALAAWAAVLRAQPHDPAVAHAALARFRVLCALRDGPRGAQAMAARLEAALRTAVEAPGADVDGPWFLGRTVIVRRNDAVLRLFNGDVGIALRGADGTLAVHFPDPAGGWRAIAPARLPPHEGALALTVHQSQGSEFDAVLLLLPRHASRVLTRELLYTAVTRARRHVALDAPAERVAEAVTTPTLRHAGLRARLAAAMDRAGVRAGSY